MKLDKNIIARGLWYRTLDNFQVVRAFIALQNPLVHNDGLTRTGRHSGVLTSSFPLFGIPEPETMKGQVCCILSKAYQGLNEDHISAGR
jgi:hypothetical protein